MNPAPFKSRFAPSPTGLLHLGNVRTALFNYLAARHAQGVFLLRIEDTDAMRGHEKYAVALEQDLRWLGLYWDGPVVHQSDRMDRYDQALSQLDRLGVLYPCFCTRRRIRVEIAHAGQAPHGPVGEAIYPYTGPSGLECMPTTRIDRPCNDAPSSSCSSTVGAADTGGEPSTTIASAASATERAVTLRVSGPELPPGLLRRSLSPLRRLFGVDAVGLVREMLLLRLFEELVLLGTQLLGSQIAAPLASRSLHRHGVSSPVGNTVYVRRPVR
jgi:hypothetical protein